jgi:hypothetical protein
MPRRSSAASLVLREQALELAVGNDLDGLRLAPPALQQRGGDERENEVAG